MDFTNFLLKDKFTKPIYYYTAKSDNDNLSEETKLKVQEQEKSNFNSKFKQFIDRIKWSDNNKKKKCQHQITIKEDEQEKLFDEPLFVINPQEEPIKFYKGTSYCWFLQDKEEVKCSIKLLDEELEKDDFYNKPVDWLIKKQIIIRSKCNKCDLEYQDFYTNEKGVNIWKCKNCCSEKIIQLVDCFHFCNKFIKELPSLIYNWAIYGNVGLFDDTNNNVYLDGSHIRLVFEVLRQICKKTNKTYLGKLGENQSQVDIYSCKLSNLDVIFAFETLTGFVKFKILDNFNVNKIIKTFINWIDIQANVFIYEDKFDILIPYFRITKVDYDENKDNLFYDSLFQLIVRNSLLDNLNVDLFKAYLDELCWRHLFADTPYKAFNFIANIIQIQKFNHNNNLLKLITTEIDEDTVMAIDEIYYGNFEPINSISRPDLKSQINEIRCLIKCHLCNIPHNFMTIHDDMSAHLRVHSSIKRKKNTSACTHCFQRFYIKESRFHKELLLGKYESQAMARSCKICCIVLKSRKELIKHLKECHRELDMPYKCELCPFRSSFISETYRHFKLVHSSVIKAHCKFCLKLFIGDNASLDLRNHLVLHKEAEDKFKCNRCALLFNSVDAFNNHFLEDHVRQKKIGLNFQLNRYIQPDYSNSTHLKVKVKVKEVDYRIEQLNNGSVIRRPISIKTKPEFFKLAKEDIKRDSILKKDYLLVNNDKLIICLECSKPMDTNHLTRNENKCENCNYRSHCPLSLNYPCQYHFSGKIDDLE